VAGGGFWEGGRKERVRNNLMPTTVHGPINKVAKRGVSVKETFWGKENFDQQRGNRDKKDGKKKRGGNLDNDNDIKKDEGKIESI